MKKMKWKNVEQELPIRNREIKNMCEEENEKYGFNFSN